MSGGRIWEVGERIRTEMGSGERIREDMGGGREEKGVEGEIGG